MLTESIPEIIELDGNSMRLYIDTRSVFTAWEESRAVGKKQRTADLGKAMALQQRMNWAVRVGNAPRLLVDILMRLYKSGLAEWLTTIGPCSLYAYEMASGSRLCVAPQPAERKRLTLVTGDEDIVATALEIAKRADKSFENNGAMLVNSKGFEVEVIVAELVKVERFSAIIISSSGHMARMHTVEATHAAVSGFDNKLLQILQQLPLVCNLM